MVRRECRAACLPGLVGTLTNGSRSTTEAVLERAGLTPYVERVFTIEGAQACKPLPAAYRHVVDACDLPAERVAMIAAHSWDVHGADLVEVAEALLSRSD